MVNSEAIKNRMKELNLRQKDAANCLFTSATTVPDTGSLVFQVTISPTPEPVPRNSAITAFPANTFLVNGVPPVLGTIPRRIRKGRVARSL